MKTLLLIAIVAISSASPYRQNNFNTFGSDENDDDLVHPPWWHPKPGRDPGPGRGFGPFQPDGSRNGGGAGPWHRRTTTEPTRITYPIYPPTSTTTSTTTTTTEKIIDSGSSASTPSGSDLTIESCKNACPVTTEHNPVCGTDNVTYGNIGLLECARMCGVNVQLKRKSRCPPTNPTAPPPTNGGNTGGSGRADNFVVQNCIRKCPVTSEYNPVCGTDNVTYTNPGRMECAKNCGVAVTLWRPVACNIPFGPSDATAACITTCSVTSEYNPVCGTDNVTYTNPGRFECARNCGLNIQISRRSECSVPPGPTNPDLRGSTESPVNNGNDNGNGTSGGNGGNGGGKGIPSMSEIIACMQLCPITPEINTVCGTDGVTYGNPGKLLCAQFCGVDVRVRKFAPCLGKPIPNPNTFVCPTLPTPTDLFTNPPTTQDCINKCAVSHELKPVCGTDGITYINIQSLQCKMKCGANVAILKLSPCESSTDQPTAQTPPVWGNTDGSTQPTVTKATPTPSPSNALQTCINKCMPSQNYKPVCGTDGITYANLPTLQCAKRCGTKVDMKTSSPCFNNPIVDGNKESSTENELGFTLPPDVIEAVFNITLPSTTEADESYEIDIKFGEPTK